MRHPRRALAALAALAAAAPLPAQGLRLSGTTTVDYVDIQPLVLDSVPIASTVDSGSLRQTSNGTIVECVASPTYCYYYRSSDRVSTAPVMQDLEVSGWGLTQGLSIYAHARARTSFGSASQIWPLSDQHLDLLAAYAELNRSGIRARLGRQWMTSDLGYYAYDGGDLLWRIRPGLAGEVYGGWGLAQGLTYARTSSALSAVEDYPPDDRGYIFGFVARYRPSLMGGVSVQYQREIRTDRAGLYSERIAAAGDLRVGRVMLQANVVNDLATGDVNDARLRVQLPIAAQLHLAAQVRHYAPFFELWTIWGAFSPVGYNEASLESSWSTPGQQVAVTLSGAYRKYGDTNTGVEFLPLMTDGWNVGASASWRMAPRWTALGGYRMAIGNGAARSDFDGGLRWQPGERGYVGVEGTAFQTVEEYVVGKGRVLGLALDGGYRITGDVRLTGNVALYHHTGSDAPQLANWDQRRATVSLQWTVGRDPGIPRGYR